MKIVGIVGWKDSGKTTIATKIINKLSSKNFRVASIKHAHHEFDIDHENTDSFKHRSAGSSQVIVSSSKRWVKISELNNSKEKTYDANILKAQDRIEKILGLKVNILNKKNNSGKIIIEYKDLEQFDLISDLLTKR